MEKGGPVFSLVTRHKSIRVQTKTKKWLRKTTKIC